MRHVVTLLATIILGIALAPVAEAVCVPARTFGTSNIAEYFYLRLGNDTGDTSEQIGRFWEPGFRSTRNEGSYDQSDWIREYYTGTDAWYLVGNLGGAGVEGCPQQELLVTVEDLVDRGSGPQAVLTLGRIDRSPGMFHDFDFTRLGRDWTSVPLPAVEVLSEIAVGSEVRLELAFPPLEEASNTLDTLSAADSILAYQVRRAVVDRGAPAPAPDIDEWTLIEDVGYTGQPVEHGPVAVDCSDGSKDVYVAVALRLSDDVITGYVGPPLQVGCPDANFEFARFDPRVALLGFGREDRDSFRLAADYGLDPQSDGIDPENEPARLSVGDFELDLPPGSFACDDGICRHEAPELEIVVTPTRVVVLLYTVDLGGISNEVDVALVLGNDQVARRLELTGRLTLPRDD